MRFKFAAALLLFVIAAAGCVPDDADEPRLVVASSESTEEPAAAQVESGAALESEVEQREAVILILNGVVKNNADQPRLVELKKVIDNDLHLDRDQAEGPEQWLTIAKVVDADGNVLWKRHVNSLFQLLEYLKIVIRETGVINLTVRQIYNFVDQIYPQLLEFAVYMPAGIEGGKNFVLEMPMEDREEMLELGRFDYQELLDQAEKPELEGEIVPLIETGPPEDRIDVVILGDGYMEGNRKDFELDAQAVAERLVETSPLSEHADFFNINAVWTPSNEVGAGYDCTGNPVFDRNCKDDLRDTVFEMVFVVTALGDQFGLEFADSAGRVAMPLQITKMYEIAALAQADEIILISNTQRRSGFAGLYVSVLTSFDARVEFPDVAVHEFGHSFGVLGDEYMVEGDPCLYNEPRVPLPRNIAKKVARSDLKWTPWVDDDTPLPTPDEEKDEHEVGAFSGAYNCPDLYRPSHTCKMKTSKREFCPVCAEQMVRRVYSVVDPTPLKPATVERVDDTTLKFAVPLHEKRESYEVTWTLGEEEIANGSELELAMGSVPEEWTTLEATVTESSGFVLSPAEDPQMNKSFTWQVRTE